jgi:methionyl-tRNA formyltransferase
MSDKVSIVFMGTPDFAVPCLKSLCENDIYEVKAVYTQPDKPIGRKQILTPPPVKAYAQSQNIEVFQPTKIKKNEEVLNHLISLKPDFIVVVAYGRILPQSILDVPKYGCINIHASLLEKYRGAAPIQWSIARGEKVTGVTTMLMDAGLDTGDMLLQREVEITQDDTTEALSKKLSSTGSDLLLETLPALVNKTITPIKQNNELATFAPIINKNDGLIDWNNKSSKEINDLVRAFTPWPSVYTIFNNLTLKIISCKPIEDSSKYNYKSGQLVDVNKEGIVIGTTNGCILVTRVHLSGSKEMSAGDFVRGHRLEIGHVFGDTLIC